MNLTLVLWLLNGQKYAEVVAPDTGCPLSEWRVPLFNGPRWLTAEEARAQRYFRLPEDARFVLTEDGRIAARMYDIGRRRFHYLCTTDWTPEPTDAEWSEMPPHVRERRARIQRANESYRKHLALMEAGHLPAMRHD